MHDCCIKAMALLEYFEWTLSKHHSRSKSKDVVFLCLFFIHASGWGRFLMLISYLGSIIKGRVPNSRSLRLISINGRGHHDSMYRFNQD